jgi:hypothetical protein
MKASPSTLDGHALAEHYEAMRKDIGDLDARSHTVRGLALLMRKGMAAWMKCVGDDPVRAAAPTAPSMGMRLPVGIEQNLVDILATMAMTTALEIIT